MWQVTHFGLYVDRAQEAAVAGARDREPFRAALAGLASPEAAAGDAADSFARLLSAAFRARFLDDAGARNSARHALLAPSALAMDEDVPYLLEVARSVLLAQAFELLRDDPAFAPADQAVWRDAFWTRASLLTAGDPEARSFVENIWAGLLSIAAGVVLEREPVFEAGAAIYRGVVDTAIRPEGYLPQTVEGEDGFFNLLLAVKGLILMAEAARHVGVDLWGYHNRGVSAVTAGLYPLYFYFYPEKWPWGHPPALDAAQAFVREHAGVLEMLNRQIGRPTKAIDLILKEARPVFDPYGGGPTTLTHAAAPRRGLFG